jgi:hypothetical protein
VAAIVISFAGLPVRGRCLSSPVVIVASRGPSAKWRPSPINRADSGSRLDEPGDHPAVLADHAISGEPQLLVRGMEEGIQLALGQTDALLAE